MNNFKPEHFELYEWVPQNLYIKHYSFYGENLWDLLFSYEIRHTVDRLRKRWGSAIMNDWWWSGGNQYRGYRPLECKIGAKLSQHKKGNAADLVFKHHSTDEVRDFILKNPKFDDFKYITAIEMNVPWLHIDCRVLPLGVNRILKIYP